MKLIIGGAYQGKTTYLTEVLGISGQCVVDGEVLADKSRGGLDQEVLAINHLHLFIRSSLRNGLSQSEIQRQILSWTEESPELVLVTDEIGCGVVPMDAFEREYREVTGRICCVLAKQAETVIRVCCGLGTVIKG